MKRVALYCRVSSDDQKERDTIENQIEILHTYIEVKEGFETYNEYLDNGISGTIPFDKRPEGKQLILDAEKGLFDTVLVWKVDRFGRDTLTGLSTIETLRKYNIEILSVTEPFDLNTPTGRFQFITYLNMAELERNNILDRMFIGATRAAKKGKWMGGIVPYGYSINNEGYLEINKEESKIIQKIFDLYTIEKMPGLSISTFLNSIGVPSSSGEGKGKRTRKTSGKWRASTIQRILSSTTYKGVHVYGKKATRRKELITREVPAIISVEQWDKAQLQKEKNSLDSVRNRKNRFFLLRGLIKCEYCGSTFYGITYPSKSSVYSCSGKRFENVKISGYKCDNKNINAETIEEQVWSDCLHILKNYDSYSQQIKISSKGSFEDIEAELEKLQFSLSKMKSEKNNILSLFRKNIITEEEVEEQIKEIKKEEGKLLTLIQITENKLDVHNREDELVLGMSRRLSEYHKKLDNLTDEDKYDIVRLLVKEIIASSIIEDGRRVPKVKIVYNLVKLETLKDMDLN